MGSLNSPLQASGSVLESKMVIGVDFDNTIVYYDQCFHRAALEKGLIPPEAPVNKSSIRDYLRQSGFEDVWTELQGYIYGDCIQNAPPFPNVLEFFRHCKEQRIDICIISHKSRYSARGHKYDLHLAAHNWLQKHGFYDPSGIGLLPDQVYFEVTRREKLERIAKVGCHYFIDDLPESLLEPGFPDGVKRILFDPEFNYMNCQNLLRAGSWVEVEKLIAWP